MNWTTELAAKIKGPVLLDDGAREAASTDFGRIAERKPAAVVRAASAVDVAETVKFAGRHSLHAVPRGAGHSQSSQSLSDDILLDLRGLDQVIRINTEGLSVSCQAGITWRALLKSLLPLGLSPPVLTNNLDVTVGGTLSTAGIGVASWRHGTQADHCVKLEVVTGDGERVRCSSQSNADLFNAVRAGSGWFGVITEATLRLRRHKPHCRTLYLLYDDLGALLNDLKTLMDEERFDYLEAWCAPLPQGFLKLGDERRPFAQWFFPLHCTIEIDETGGTDEAARPVDAEKLHGLHFYKHTHTEDGKLHDFFSRLDALFDLWKAGGFWNCAHPWMECILPWESAPLYIGQVIERIPSQILAGGHILLWPARGSATSVPLFARPGGEKVIGFGILPSVPKHLLPRALPMLKQAGHAGMMLGGKRYISGWLDFDAADWKEHYGALMSQIIDLKQKYDPQRVFNDCPDYFP